MTPDDIATATISAMLKRATATLVLLVSTLSCTMWNKAGSGWGGATGGEQLERLFWQDVRAKDWTAINRHVASSFAGSGPNGAMDKQAFVRSLQQHPLADFSLSDCQVQLNGADIVVSCLMHTQSAEGKAVQASTLSVWQQVKKGWIMIAHAETPS